MDKRLVLNEEQKKLVARFNELAKEMDDAKIGIIYKEYGELYCYNNENINETFFDEDIQFDEGDVRVEIDELDTLDLPIGLNLTWAEDNSFGVSFND